MSLSFWFVTASALLAGFPLIQMFPEYQIFIGAAIFWSIGIIGTIDIWSNKNAR